MASLKLTASTVLDTVSNTAAVISDTAKTASGAVNMLNRFVESASVDQKDRQLIHRKTFRDNLLRESRISIAQSNKEVIDFCAESEANAKLYEAATEYLPDSIFDS